MGKNRQTIKRDFLGNFGRIQNVLNAPQFIKTSYISPKGLRLLKGCDDEALAAEIVAKYTKNRIRRNPDCTHIVKTILHTV